MTLTTDGFTAICPVTGIPDHGEVVIEYWPSGHLMELETVRHYLTAYRHQHMTVEYTAARIADDVQRAINPLGVRVTVRHNPREGLHNQAVAVRTRNGEPLDATTAK